MFVCVFFLMIRRPPRSTLTDTLFPYATLFRSADGGADLRIAARPAEARARLLSEVLVRVVAVITILLCHAPEGGPRHCRCPETLSEAVVPGLVPGTQCPRRLKILPLRGEAFAARSEERRVGKGCVNTCRFRGAPYH